MSLQEPQNPFPRSVRPYAQVGAFANLNIGRIGGNPGDRLFLTALHMRDNSSRASGLQKQLYESLTQPVPSPTKSASNCECDFQL